MMKLLAAFHLDSPDSMKRFLVLVLGGAAVLFINPLLVSRGLQPLSDVALGTFATIATGFLLQSGLKSAKIAAVEADAQGAVDYKLASVITDQHLSPACGEGLRKAVAAGRGQLETVPEPKPTAPGGA